MKHRARNRIARRRRPALSYRLRWERELAQDRAFMRDIPLVVAEVDRIVRRRNENRRRKGKLPLGALDRQEKPFLSYLNTLPRI